MFIEQRLANPKQAHNFTGLFWISNVRYGGSPPSPPPQPDYASANRAGVLADAETLASRRAIDNAAKFGGKTLAFGVVTKSEPVIRSGFKTQTYQVQTGTRRETRGRQTVEVPIYETRTRYVDSNGKEVTKAKATTSGTAYYQLYNDKGERLPSPRKISKQEAVIDFKGLSDIDAAKKLADFQRSEGKVTAQYLLDVQKQYGSQFAEQARSQLRAIDPEGFDLRETLAKESQSTVFEKVEEDDLPEFANLADAPDLEMTEAGPSLTRMEAGPTFGNLQSGNTLERIGTGPTFGLQNYGPQFALGSEFEGGGAAALGRAEVERQLGEQLANEGRLTVEEERRLNNAVRGGQVARGNTQGNAPLAQEILARFGAETDRARQARSDVVGYLQSGQSSFDVAKAIRQEANQLAQQGYINYSTALGVNNNLAQKEFENQIAAIGQRNSASQTELDNINKAIMGDNQALQQAYDNYKTQVGVNNAMSLTEYQNSINAVSTRNQTRQQTFANQNMAIQYQNQMAQQGYQNLLNNITQNNQATQQRFANMQTFAGLSPIVSQGGQLSSLQQQAAPFMQTPVPQGMGLNPNAGQQGTQFALGVYDNQTRQYQSQMQYAQANSPLNWVTGIGGILF